MGNTGVIDQFLGVFTSYIDSGQPALGGEVRFIATTLIVIDAHSPRCSGAGAPTRTSWRASSRRRCSSASPT